MSEATPRTDLRFVQKLASSPWLADPDHVQFLHGLFLRYLDRAASGQPLDIRAVEHETGRPLDNTREVTVRDGVARIPVEGTIMRRASLFTAMSGGVSTEALMRDFNRAYNDPSVHSILFSFDTPGGEAHGINELAAAIREKRDLGEKTIEAYCDGLCASAGYWLASATEAITADPTAALGSIGVVTRVRNPEAAGKEPYLEFWNARSPKKRLDPNSESGKETIQEYVDDMGDEFIEAVADNRGVTVEKVVADFGQGFVLTGRRAVEAGLADALGSEEEVIARLQRRERPVTEKPWRPGADMETGQQYSEPAQTDVSERDSEAEGLMARLRAFLGLEPQPTAILEATHESVADSETGGNSVKLEKTEGREGEPLWAIVSNSGERLELSEKDRHLLASDADRDLLAEAETAKAERDRYKAAYEEAIGKARTEAVEREIAAYVADEVPPYLLELARPALVAGYDAAEGSPEATEATRWREVLAGAPKLEHGERGSAAGKPMGEMSDDEKVRAEIAERGLDPRADYGKVAGELAAKGEIRRGNSRSVESQPNPQSVHTNGEG